MVKQLTLGKLERELKSVKREVSILRSFAIGLAGKDPEGEYRPEFVREILQARGERADYVFRGKSSFLAELRRRKKSQ